VEHLRRYPEIALVGGPYYLCDELNRPRRLKDPPHAESAWIFERLLVRNAIGSASIPAFRREALEAVGGFSERPRSQEWDTYLRIAKRYPVGFVRDPVALWRNHAGNSSQGLASGRIEINAEIFEEHVAHVRPAWRRGLLRRRSRAASFYFAATSSIRRGEVGRGRRLLLRSIRLDPFGQAVDKVVLLLRTTLPAPLYRRVRTVFGPRLVRRG
jgi:hypothetical protein